MNCPLQTPAPIHPFAYRVHAHKLGGMFCFTSLLQWKSRMYIIIFSVVISGYRVDQSGQFEQIGKVKLLKITKLYKT